VTLFDPPASRERAAPSGPLVRVRMTVAYDGRSFHGFAANPGVQTVGGTLARSIERVLGHAVELTCAGRTDAGVHARGQVVSFDAAVDGLDLVAMQRSVNKLCGPEIAVCETAVAAPDFDARRSARARHYRYQVLNAPVPDPFLAATAWYVEAPIDLRAMRLACDPLIGEHDFSSFCRRPRTAEPVSLVRRVRRAEWCDLGDGLLQFWIEADAFCHQMVRSVVATLVDVGRGKRRAGDVSGIIRACDRSAAAMPAPPHGLCLWAVTYDGDDGDDGEGTSPRK
jgi:tRNA pseudouridine38-40 synthase